MGRVNAKSVKLHFDHAASHACATLLRWDKKQVYPLFLLLNGIHFGRSTIIFSLFSFPANFIFFHFSDHPYFPEPLITNFLPFKAHLSALSMQCFTCFLMSFFFFFFFILCVNLNSSRCVFELWVGDGRKCTFAVTVLSWTSGWNHSRLLIYPMIILLIVSYHIFPQLVFIMLYTEKPSNHHYQDNIL